MPRWLGFLTLAGAAAAAENADACLRNLGPQQFDEVCGSDGVVYDSYAHALCHNAIDAGWRRGACERRALSEDFEGPQESARPADGARLALANSRMFGTNGAYASVRARIGDTRRILDLRTSGEAAEWCGAHIADTRRRMDRASTVAPSSRASTLETIETQDSTTEAH